MSRYNQHFSPPPEGVLAGESFESEEPRGPTDRDIEVLMNALEAHRPSTRELTESELEQKATELYYKINNE